MSVNFMTENGMITLAGSGGGAKDYVGTREELQAKIDAGENWEGATAFLDDENEGNGTDSGLNIEQSLSELRQMVEQNKQLIEYMNEKYRQNGSYLQLTDLGSSYTSELKEDIVSGTFKKAVVGGKLTLNNHVYYFAHPDYWFNCGDTPCTTHHMLVVPAGNIVNAQMHETGSGQHEDGAANTTEGGYIGSDMKKTGGGLEQIKEIIKADFGELNILTHRELFVNATTNGMPSAGAWYDSDIDLMNEPMVYGHYIFTAACDGMTAPYIYTIDKSQIELFALRPDLICNRSDWWLRDVVSDTNFAYFGSDGNALYGNASYLLGVRPAFGIC